MGAACKVDYTRMELGTVTWRGDGGRLGIVARCPKCSERGERRASLPDKGKALLTEKPSIMWTHVAERVKTPIGSFHVVSKCCVVRLDKTNVDDLLSVAERKLYDAFVSQLRVYVEQF